MTEGQDIRARTTPRASDLGGTKPRRTDGAGPPGSASSDAGKLGGAMDLTKRHNVVLLMTITLVLLAIAAVLAAKGLLVLGPVGVTMVESGLLAAYAANPRPGCTDFREPPQPEVRRNNIPPRSVRAASGPSASVVRGLRSAASRA